MKQKLFRKVFFTLILFHWILPNFNSMDNIGSQWFYLSVINFFVLVFNLFFDKNNNQTFYLNKILIAPILLLIWGFTGLFNAINISEVIIESSRYFNVIVSFYNLLILIRNGISLNYVINNILIFLSYEVIIIYPKIIEYFQLNGYVDRQRIGSGVAANINITSYSILLKIPFLFYVFLKSKQKFIKGFLWILSFLSFLLISIFATRSALICISTLLIFILFLTIYNKKKNELKNFLVVILLPIFFSTSLNSIIQRNSSQSTIDRIESLTYQDDKSTSRRIAYYKEAIKEFTEEPIFGVGIGNYKIHSIRTILNNESQYVVPYNTHNDFLQVLAELSVIGLIFYLLFIYGNALQIIRKRKWTLINIILLVSLTIYTFDAMFNFPHARPLIQIVLVIILAILYQNGPQLNSKTINFKWIFILFIFISIGSIYINKRVFNSLIEQNILAFDYKNGVFNRDPEIIKTFEEDFPNLNTAALPIKALKANYFSITEPDLALKKLDLAIKDNPVIMFPHVVKSLIFMRDLKIDSAYYYSRLAFDKGPTIEFHANAFLNFIGFLKKNDELEYALDKISNSKSEIVWTKYINTLFELKKNIITEKDKELLNELVKKFPTNKYFKNLNSTKELTFDELKIVDSIGKKADSLFQLKIFDKALGLYIKANKLHPNEPAYMQNIAVSYFRNEDYDNCKIFLDKLYDEYGVDNGFKEYYLGSIEVKQGTGNGCDYFFKSYDKGFKSGEIMYKNFCLNKN